MKRESSATLQFYYLQKLFHHFQLERFAPLKLSSPKKKFLLFSKMFCYHWHLFHLNCYDNLSLSFAAVKSNNFVEMRIIFFLLSSVLSFKNLLRSLVLFMISFERVLFINGIWFPLAHFCFRGACWYNVDWHILKNSSKLLLSNSSNEFDISDSKSSLNLSFQYL